MEVSLHRHADRAEGERAGTQHYTITKLITSASHRYPRLHALLYICTIFFIMTNETDAYIWAHLFLIAGEMCALLACRGQRSVRRIQRGVEERDSL